MSRTPLQAARCYYDSLLPGKRAELMEVLDPHVVLELPEGFPGGGGIYRGLKAYLEDYLFRLYGGFDMDTSVEEYVASGDRVIALGWHHGRAIATGQRIQVRFAHAWTVRDGRLVSGLMYTDTGALCGAAHSKPAAEGAPSPPRG